jgi:hypothetical protein
MAAQSKSKPRIEKAEDLPNIFTKPTHWPTLKECERAVFLSLDLNLALRSKVTLLEAMALEVTDIVTDAFQKGILVRHQDGSVVLKSH